LIVVDASALLESVVGDQPDPELVIRLAGDELHAPHLVDVEILHALRVLVTRNAASAARWKRPGSTSAGSTSPATRLMTSDVVARSGPLSATLGPMVGVAFERVEALELLAMTFAHLNDAEARGEVSPRVPLLMAIRDKLALALREAQ